MLKKSPVHSVWFGVIYLGASKWVPSSTPVRSNQRKAKLVRLSLHASSPVEPKRDRGLTLTAAPFSFGATGGTGQHRSLGSRPSQLLSLTRPELRALLRLLSRTPPRQTSTARPGSRAASRGHLNRQAGLSPTG
ncbi:hypothetical protein NDU88_002446 [Pleurodeles waltl]|uniref:Uncharacterized protein n=1 Tax=Pleurodeles waltl TaxID=8319 RepID=A0AAV7P9E7_PLEWA|nr:hypothetical protein NDU88_002446 [Pleurodeles waltl]